MATIARVPLVAATTLVALAATVLWSSTDGAPPTRGGDEIVVVAAPARVPAGGPVPASSSPMSPVIGSAARLSEQMRGEARDAAWADGSAALLQHQLAEVPALADDGGLRVSCAATLCEATGRAPPGLDAANRAIWWDMVQGPAVRAFMDRQGLHVVTAELAADDGVALYFRRSQPRADATGWFG